MRPMVAGKSRASRSVPTVAHHNCADHGHEPHALREARAVDTEDAASKLVKTTNKFLSRWLEALDRYYATVEDIASGVNPESGAKFSDIAAATGPARSKAAAQLVVDWHATIETGFVEAHTLGVKEWGAQAAKQPSTGALRAQIAREKRFSFNFAMDVARGFTNMPGRMNAGLRSAMYGSSLAGCFQRGSIDGSPDGMMIHWVLGIPKSGKHCVACPILSQNGPYSRETIPSAPRACQTPCMSLCLCSLEYKAIDLSPPTEEEVTVGAMGNIPVADRAAGVMPTPPPGRRLPNDRERAILQDLEQRRNFASRRAQEAHEAGDEATRDEWLGVARDCTKRSREFADTKDADGKSIFWVKTWSAKEVLRGDDIRAPDVSFLTHIKAIDGTTVSRVQVEARRQAAEAARKDAAALISSLPAETSPTVPNFRDLVKLAGAPAGIFDATFPAGVDWLVDTSAAGADARARLDELVTDVTPDASAEVTVTAIGMGGAATLRLGSVMLAALGSKADAYANVRVGPMGDDWPALALTAGMWVQGPSKSVDAFLADVRRKFKGRGIATSYWQA